jgi:DNA-3-methyladenine glycosylase
MECVGRLLRDFYIRDVLDVAPALLGKNLVLFSSGNELSKFMITEVEAYRGMEDKACHASKGRTPRTEIMFHEGGRLYMYFIYGMYWMLNIVTEKENVPQAVLIRGLENLSGPGKLTRTLGLDKSFYGEDLTSSDRIWIEETCRKPVIRTSPRIGVDYAGDWKDKLWRFYI